MITILFVTFCFYLLAELVKQGAAQKARKREMARQARIEAEMRRDREQRERIAREQKEQREAMIAYEKEMRRLHLEQMREEKERQRLEAEQARLEREQQKQAEQIAKQEIRLLALEQKIALADHDIDFYRPQVEQAEKEIRELDNKVWYFTQKGLPCEGYKTKLEKKQKALHQIQTKLIKAEQAKALAERQIEAA